MRINPNSGAGDVAKVAREARANEAAGGTWLGSDNLAASASRAMDQACVNAPAVRPEKVAEAKALLSGDSYPSSAQLGEVAGLLAKYLSR